MGKLSAGRCRHVRQQTTGTYDRKTFMPTMPALQQLDLPAGHVHLVSQKADQLLIGPIVNGGSPDPYLQMVSIHAGQCAFSRARLHMKVQYHRMLVLPVVPGLHNLQANTEWADQHLQYLD